ncbi:MAG: hypothetical protein IJS52_05580 [Bacilli bacterium]|nr:hypothetical protein [Bacilli bacterium]
MIKKILISWGLSPPIIVSRGHFGAAIKIKYHAKPISSARLLNSAENALKQIERKEYIDELQIHSADPIYAYGFAFMKNKVAIKAKRIK